MENISISYSALEARFLKLENRLNDVLAKNKNLRLSNNRLSKELVTLKTRYEKLSCQYQELNNELKRVKAENRSLSEQNKILLAENKELTVQNAELVAKNKALELKYLSLQRQLFGKKKDKINQSRKADSEIADYLRKNKQKSGEESKKRGRREIAKDYQPDIIKEYDFKDIPACDCWHGDMNYLGSNESHHMDYEVVLKKVKIKQQKYVCQKCNNIKMALGSKLPIAKGVPLEGLLTKAILDKFGMGMPFYRQSQNWGYGGINYSRQQLNGWFEKAAYLVGPLVKLMYSEMLRSDYLACDETELLLLNKEDMDSGAQAKDGKVYMCVMKEGGKAFNFVYCWPVKSRKQEEISKKLSDFKGFFQSDGLNFYYAIQSKDGVIKVNCWAHVRRKFVEIALLTLPDGEGAVEEGIAFEMIKMIDKLYRVEKEGKFLPAKELLKMRRTRSAKILKEIKGYLKNHQSSVPPKSRLGNAIKYTVDRWDGLTSYLKDARIEIDNNETERCVKYFVIGRKNWLFADNLNSAENSGILYSLVMTCKINNINPKEYFEYIFKQLPYINRYDTELLEQLLPDRYDKTKRFDEEYRESLGIVERIIVNNGPGVILAQDLKVA